MPDSEKDRVLQVSEKRLVLHGENVPALFAAELIYECGEGHDLHLDPHSFWGLDDVELLVSAIKGVK